MLLIEHFMHFMHTYIHAYMHHPNYLLYAAIIAARWVREEGRLVKRTVTSTEMAGSSDNTRMDQLEVNMNKMAEQLQTLADAIANSTSSQNGGARTSRTRQEGSEDRMAEEIPNLNESDDLADSQVELQKLKEQMESITREMKGEHEDLLDYDTMAFEEQLPAEFKMPNMVKFNGNGDPKVHLRQYVSMMSTAGLSKRQVLKMFGMSLKEAPVVWYHSLEKKVKDDWRALAEAFLNQYVTDMEIDLSLRDLENTNQGQGESFKEYVDRWRS